MDKKIIIIDTPPLPLFGGSVIVAEMTKQEFEANCLNAFDEVDGLSMQKNVVIEPAFFRRLNHLYRVINIKESFSLTELNDNIVYLVKDTRYFYVTFYTDRDIVGSLRKQIKNLQNKQPPTSLPDRHMEGNMNRY